MDVLPVRLKTLIVDDEPLARRGLELRLADAPDIEIVGQCANGEEAVRKVAEIEPDLMFLDVQMPGLDGFATLRAIPASQMPMVVFVTAYDHYAIRAFEASAVDYLLKPIDDSRLHQALFRVRQEFRERQAEQHLPRLLSLLGELSGKPALTLEQVIEGELPKSRDRKLAIKDGTRTVRVDPATIRWVDAAGDYMCIHTEADTHILRATMRELEQQLDPQRFQRIHRSTIVNVDRVKEMRAHINGEYFLVLDSGHELKLSRTYKDKIALLK
ncbi:MAG TPA: LytTR family DNA-binding domain-containing protein [Xanthomonadales bacterium]|nr:LytTR family DNA-binding domain-containing protein [Xanthomonadales bacterium]